MEKVPLFWEEKWASNFYKSFIEIVLNNNRTFFVGFEKRERELLIPGRLTFGGFYPLDGGSVSKRELLELLHELMSKTDKPQNLVWKFPPGYFYPQIFEEQQSLVESFMETKVMEINQHLFLPDWTERSLSKGNQKKYRQVINQKVEYKIADPQDISMCYEILLESRKRIGASVSMSEEEIKNALLSNPEIYRLVYLELGGVVLAVGLTVDLAQRVRYVLYWADNIHFRHFSPIVYLSTKIIEDAKQDEKAILDLGISSFGGILNEGLFRFKTNLGAKSSFKPTYKMDLSRISL
jgi:hypothetical protein